jgi:hypothetical protein
MALTFFDAENNEFGIIADSKHSFQPPSYTSSTINRDQAGNVTSIVYRKSGSAVYTLTVDRPDATHTVISDGVKTLTITTNESGQPTGSTWL